MVHWFKHLNEWYSLMETEREILRLSDELSGTQKILSALGDEMRQHLILVMLNGGDCSGMRVGDIADQTRLSRPAVSHHLQILKDAGIVKMRREGTRNYYYFSEETEAMDALIAMLAHAREIMRSLPDRSGGWDELEE